MGCVVEKVAGEVADSAGRIRGENSDASAVTSHGESKKENAGGEIGEEMSEIAVQTDGGENSPPFSGSNSMIVHDAIGNGGWLIERAPGMSRGESKNPEEAGPVKIGGTARERLPPAPATVLESILLDCCQCTGM